MTPAGLVLLASSLVNQQQGKPVDEVRAIERRLAALDRDVRKLGPAAAPVLGKAAADPKSPAKLKLWLVVYLQTLDDPAAFLPLKRLLLDHEQPDGVRGQAARAVAQAPVSPAARRRALCRALAPEREPGRETLLETLFALRDLGCDDPALLELWAFDTRLSPKGDEAKIMMMAVKALGASVPPKALDSLDRLFARYRSGSPERRLVLETLLRRADDMKLERRSWTDRAIGMLEREANEARNTELTLKILLALGDTKAVKPAARLLKSRDGAVVVAAAEILAAHGAVEHGEAVEAILAGFMSDERFAPAEHRDPPKLHERLEAAVRRLR